MLPSFQVRLGFLCPLVCSFASYLLMAGNTMSVPFLFSLFRLHSPLASMKMKMWRKLSGDWFVDFGAHITIVDRSQNGHLLHITSPKDI